MPSLPDPPYLNHEKVQIKAKSFLKKFNPADEIPVPIERIVDVQLGILITGIPGLLKQLDIDGFLLSDLKEIMVDKDLYDRQHPRFLFTLAHEMGHYFLHRKIYKQIAIKDTATWKAFHNSLEDDKLKWYEIQAHLFAGYILVPRNHLKKRCEIYLNKIKKAGIRNQALILDKLLHVLARDFMVSSAVIKRRLKREELLPVDLYKELLLTFEPKFY
ncbi:MAG: ImmA/IrrE family metallo-endopeptidase [Candidatus Omnitrophota bacterium]